MLKARLGFISKRAHLYKNRPLPFLFFKDLKEARKTIKKHSRIYYLRNAFSSILTS